MVVASFGLRAYPGFEDGKHGLYVIFPGGDPDRSPSESWKELGWYRPSAKDRASPRYDWCKDGARAGNAAVETWFELLESWYGGDAAPSTGEREGLRATEDDDD